MATHAKVRTSWVSNQPVLHQEFAALDFGQFDSISCSGGTYAPAAVITVGGAGMNLVLVGSNTLTGNLNLTSTAFIEITAGCLLLSDLGSFIGFSGSVAFNPSSVTVFAAGSTTSLGGVFEMPSTGVLQTDAGSTVLLEGSVTLGPTASLAVGCVSTFSATINTQAIAAASVSVSGPVACTGISVTGPGVISSSIGTTGAAGRFVGRVVKTTVNAAGAAGQSASPLTAQMYYFPSAASGSNIQIDDTNAVDGDQLIFVTAEPTNGIIVKNPGGASITAILNATGIRRRAECTRIGGVWTLTASEFVP